MSGTLYPGAFDNGTSLPDPGANSDTAAFDHASLHDADNAAIRAIEAKVGITASTPTNGKVLTGGATPGSSTWVTPAPAGVWGAITGTISDQTDLTSAIAAAQATILQTVYAVGSLYFSTSVSTSPATILGFGTWVAIAGYTLVGFKTADGDFGTLGVVAAGEKTHALVLGELAVHNHTATDSGHGHGVSDSGHNHALWSIGQEANVYTLGGTSTRAVLIGGTPNSGNGVTGTRTTGISINSGNAAISVANTGSGTAHNNIQPSFVVYMWQRTA